MKNQNKKFKDGETMKSQKVSTRTGQRAFTFYMDERFHKLLSEISHNDKSYNIGSVLNDATLAYILENHSKLSKLIYNPDVKSIMKGIADGQKTDKTSKTG